MIFFYKLWCCSSPLSKTQKAHTHGHIKRERKRRKDGTKGSIGNPFPSENTTEGKGKREREEISMCIRTHILQGRYSCVVVVFIF